tara:strand:- start:128 stop:484 length:357 start_codon:yes stop_codon:yes gene_type:complete
MEEEKFIFEDQHAMRLTHYVMAERCMQVEAHKIIEEWKANATHETLAFILEGGFKGFHNYTDSELIAEYIDGAEDKWYDLHADGELPWDSYEDDPIHQLLADEAGELEEAARKARSVL